LKTLDLVYGADGKSRSLYSLRHMYATFAQSGQGYSQASTTDGH
jgi:hypothetical protein